MSTAITGSRQRSLPRHRPGSGAVLLVLALASCLACGGAAEPPASRPAGNPPEPPGVAGAATSPGDGAVRVENPRATLLPDVGAVYLTLVNTGGDDDRLLAVETSAAADAEIHETTDEGWMMHMAHQAGGLLLPAGSRLELAPGGRHIMLMGPRWVAGQTTIQLTLRFERAGTVEVEARVVDPSQLAP